MPTATLRPNSTVSSNFNGIVGGTLSQACGDGSDGTYATIAGSSDHDTASGVVNIGDLPGSASAVTSVQFFGRFSVDFVSDFEEAGAYFITHGSNYGSMSNGGATSPTTRSSSVYTNNPFTGVAWTISEVNALQANIYTQSDGFDGSNGFAYDVWFEVVYTEAATANNMMGMLF